MMFVGYTNQPVDNSQPSVAGQPPAAAPLIYETGQTTATPAADLQTFRDFEPAAAADPDAAAEYQIGWGQFVSTALQSQGANTASQNWSVGQEDSWQSIRDNAAEPLISVAEENRRFWVAVVIILNGDPPQSPWNGESYLSAAYKWGWYSAVMFNRPAGEDIVGIETWTADKNAYWP